MANKRDFIRYVIDAKISFRTKKDESRVIQGQVVDISTLGWGAFLKESIDVGTIIDFDLTVNFFDTHLIGTGRIISVVQSKDSARTGFRIGMEFIEVDKVLVLKFISENQRMIEGQRKRVEKEKNIGWGSTECGAY